MPSIINTCLSALSAQKNGKELAKDFVKEPQNRSKGCGGIMRVAPVALNYKRVEMDTLDMEGAQFAAITHGHSLGYMPAAIVTHIINRIVFGEEKKTLKNIVIEARDKVAEIFRGDKHLKELTDIIDLADDLCHGCQMSEFSHYEDTDWTRKYIYMQWKEKEMNV